MTNASISTTTLLSSLTRTPPPNHVAEAPNSSDPYPILNPKCDRYYFENRTYILYNGYEGIPETLLINVIAWLILLILFTFLRKIAWDYGRIALVSRNEEKSWRDLYCERNLLDAEGESRYNVWTTLFYGDHDHTSIGSQDSLDTSLRMQDKGILAWIPAFFRIRDADILKKCGHDAIQYIQFQRHLLIYLALICVLSIAIVLPVNISENNSNGSEFGDTTISNVLPGSKLLWIHAILAVVYLLIAVFFMRRFSTNLEYDEDEQVSRTLLVSNIPKDRCFRNTIDQHFQEAYPEAVVVDIQFAYNISKLVSLDANRQRTSEAKRFSELTLKRTGKHIMIRPHTCGRCCCCNCCGSRPVDAVEYYTEEETMLREACEEEKVTAFQEPLGIAFITLDADHMAERIRADFRASCKGAHNPQTSRVYRELNVPNWAMKYAPAPENIYWENLSLTEWKWWVRAILINIVLVILLFFFTTPTIIMNSLDEIKFQKRLEDTHSAVLVSFMPTILLWTFSALLPNVVYYSDQFVGHWTKTAEHHSVMRKTFIFLLLMVLILPSLGLTSAKALFEWLVIDNTGTGKKYRWQCIFLAGNGAFFVNYVITSAFIGTALELMRFSQLFMYAVKLLCSRSAAEKTTVRKSVVWEFQFGIQYAWMLCVFTIIMAYSIPCPLVMPFGMVYMGLKHLVDRYNIFFAYAPSKIDKNIHTSAVTFVIAAVIFLQLTIVFFSALRTAELSVDPVFIFSAVALFITLVVFFGRIFFGWFKGLSPIKYKNAGQGSRSPDESEPFSTKTEADGAMDKPFVPSVLAEHHDQDEELPVVGGYTYGSTGSVNLTDSTIAE